MATKPKKNQITKEIKKYEEYVYQVMTYLDNNPIENITDRLDVQYNNRTGHPVTKVIASKEVQVTAFTNQLKLLPGFLEALNNLRKIAESENEDGTISKARGGKELPGIFNRMLTNSTVNERNAAEEDKEFIESEDVEIIDEPKEEEEEFEDDE